MEDRTDADSQGGCLIPLLVVLSPVVVTIATGKLVTEAWAACDVGVNATANLWGYLFFTGPFLLVTASLASAAGVFAGHRWSLAIGLATGILLMAAAVFVHLWLFATPADYPSPFCDENVPPWWPSWLPT